MRAHSYGRMIQYMYEVSAAHSTALEDDDIAGAHAMLDLVCACRFAHRDASHPVSCTRRTKARAQTT
jgi:hypothetical protein